MEADEPLDFEFEDTSLVSPSISKKTKRVIGLDDLLNDYYKEKVTHKEKVKKRAKVKKDHDSDDNEVDAREAKLHEFVNEFHEKMNQIKADDEIPLWGLQVFGSQKAFPEVDSSELISNCSFLHSVMNHELNSLIELKKEEGQSFFEGLLLNGWLLKVISSNSRFEKPIAKWSFYLLLYSPLIQLGSAACDFWCSILLSNSEMDQQKIEIEWLPSHMELKSALDVYGFLLDSPCKSSLPTELDHSDSNSCGPPQNIRSWIKFVSASCQVRTIFPLYTTEEVQDLIVVVICMFMDRQLLGLSLILDECLRSLISVFSDSDFDASCIEIAKSLTQRLTTDISCLRTVECISVLDARTKQLRSAVAFQFLIACFNDKVTDGEGILKAISSINLKDEEFDLEKMYIYLILVENWLFCDPKLKGNLELNKLWAVCLRNCCHQISRTDLRSYALKVRSKASYLFQGNAGKW